MCVCVCVRVCVHACVREIFSFHFQKDKKSLGIRPEVCAVDRVLKVQYLTRHKWKQQCFLSPLPSFLIEQAIPNIQPAKLTTAVVSLIQQTTNQLASRGTGLLIYIY